MEQRFYKVRLTGGRVIGPLDLDRIRLFIAKEKIQGLEMARLYPTGDWKDINTYPEIAELLMLKLEGKLTATVSSSEAPENLDAEIEKITSPEEPSGIAIEPVPPPPVALPTSTAMPSPTAATATPAMNSADVEATLVLTVNDEATMVQENPIPTVEVPPSLEEIAANADPVELAAPAGSIEMQANPLVSNEKTAMLTRPKGDSAVQKKSLTAGKKKFVVVIMLVLGALFAMLPDENAKQVGETAENAPFKVEMPNSATPDPQKSEKLFLEGIRAYSEDTVDGYKKAARLFLKAATLDQNNARALCLLASSYLNLIDVLPKDENYFTVVTRLIELERAKGMDLAETVIADVELYHVLGNPDAGVTRIVEYSKSHPQFGLEMYYYLALSFYLKGQYAEALKYLNNIDPKNYFSPKINYLYGMIYEKNGQFEDALRSYLETVARSPKHIKGHVKLAGIYFKKDNLPESGKHGDFAIHNQSSASHEELAKAYYYRAKMEEVASREPDALHDLEAALKNAPEDEDILLDYYTLKARLGSKVQDAQGKAKMFHFLALGEKSMKENNLHEAISNFMSARDALGSDPTPLLRIAEVYRRKGDLQSAKNNLAKAVTLAPQMLEIYPKYIKTLVDAYEFEEATKTLTSFKGLGPASSVIDRLQGDIYFKQEKLREANSYYKRALAALNVDSSAYIAYANLMFKGNNFRDSAFYYGLALRFDPFNVDATIGIGKSLAEIESLEKGVGYVQSALQISPHKAALLNGVGEIFLRKGDYNSSLKYAENALATDPAFSLAHKTKGDAFTAQEKVKEALDAYLTYTNLAPLDPAGFIERYRIYLKKLDLKSAKENIEKVIANYPKYPGVYYMLGELYREGQNFPAAMKSAEEEIKNNPTYVPAYVLAGMTYNLAHDYTNALQALNKALRLSPNYVPALIQAGIANHALKTYAAARSMLERALAQDGGNPEIHKRLALVFMDIDHREDAMKHFRAYLDLFPNAPDREEVERLIGK